MAGFEIVSLGLGVFCTRWKSVPVGLVHEQKNNDFQVRCVLRTQRPHFDGLLVYLVQYLQQWRWSRVRASFVLLSTLNWCWHEPPITDCVDFGNWEENVCLECEILCSDFFTKSDGMMPRNATHSQSILANYENASDRARWQVRTAIQRMRLSLR